MRKLERINKNEPDFDIDELYLRKRTVVTKLDMFNEIGEREIAPLIAEEIKNIKGFMKERLSLNSPTTRGYPVITLYKGNRLAFRDWWDGVCKKINAQNPHPRMTFFVENAGPYKECFYIQIDLRKAFRNL